MQQHDVESQFPDQGLNLGHSGESAKSKPVDHQGTSPKLHALSFFFFPPFRAAPTAYEGSQARGQIELQLPACTTATAMQNPSCICNLHHSSQQGPILNPLSKARDGIPNLLVPSQICFCCATTRTPQTAFLIEGAVAQWRVMQLRVHN